jgi:lipoate-protein ligase A
LQQPHAFEISTLAIADQQVHIERSEQLLSRAAPGSMPLLCWSQAEPEALVLGFSQQESILNHQAVAHERIPVYQRRAGGTAVLVGPDLLGLDIILPAGHPLVLADLVESYRWLGETWVHALHLLGVETRSIPPQEAREQRTLAKRPQCQARETVLCRACYASNSPYEVVVGQRKLVGLDMIRRRNGSLLQAGLLLHWNAGHLARLLGHTPAEQELLRTILPERAVGLDELTGRVVGTRDIIQAFTTALFAQ